MRTRGSRRDLQDVRGAGVADEPHRNSRLPPVKRAGACKAEGQRFESAQTDVISQGQKWPDISVACVWRTGLNSRFGALSRLFSARRAQSL